MLIIPEFDGKHAIRVVRFSFDHFTESWEYVLYNNGQVFRDGKLVGSMSQNDIRNLIHGLNAKGFFGVTENGIFYKLAGPRRMNILELLLPPPSRPFVPAPVIDGGQHDIQVDLSREHHCISFYAIPYYVMEFPTCQDVQILNESIGYLSSVFRELGDD